MAEKYIDWNPFSLSYLNNKMDMDASLQGSTDGTIFSYNPLQSTIKSIGANQNTIALLTEATGLSSLQAAHVNEYSDSNLVRNSLLTNDGWRITRTLDDVASISLSTESVGNIFKLEFDDNDQVLSIVAEDIDDRKYLTIASNGLSSYFGPYSTNYDYLLRFKYLLNTDTNTLVLFCNVNNDGNYKAVTYDENSTTTGLSAVSAFSYAIAPYCVFNLAVTDRSIRNNKVDQSKYIKYDVALENDKTFYDDLTIVYAKSFNNNFLFTMEPNGEKETEGAHMTYVEANNIALKNLLNTQYNPDSSNSTVQNRDYTNVFLGNNIDNDFYNKPLLSYQSSKKQIDLPPDHTTYFHYPYGTTSINISAAGFIKAGAIAGTSPEKSDRIWKAQDGYSDRTNTGSSVVRNGVWLCSWLLDTDNGAIWMDRWYDPNNATYKDALTADEPNIYIKDTTSTMMMEPSVLYKYFHIGTEYSLKLIEDAGFNNNGKILEIKDWDAPGINIVNGGQSNIKYNKFNESELTLTGTEYIEFSANESFYPEYQLSLASWVNFNNWRNAPVDQIMGNYYEGGYGIGFDTGIKTDLVIFADRNYGHLFITNTENKYLNDKAVPGLSATVTDISFDGKGNVWVLDGNNSKVHIYNPINNTFTKTITLPASSEYVFSNNDAFGNFYAYDESRSRFSKIAASNGYVTHTNLSSLKNTFLPVSTLSAFPINGFFIDENSYIQPYIGNTAFEDVNGDVWHHFGSNFVKNNSDYVLHLCSPEDIKIDGDYNIWYIKGKTLYHADREGNMLFSKEYPYLTGGTKKLTLTREVTTNGWADFVWVLDGNSLIKFTSDGKFVAISKPKEFLNISQYDNRDRNKLDIFLPQKATQYDFHRDRKVMNPGLKDTNYITANFNINTGDAHIPYKLKYSTNCVSRGWHHIAFVFNSSDGTAKLYFDGVVQDSLVFTKGINRLAYDYKNKFYIGNTNGYSDNKSQNYLLNNDVKMVGSLDDVRVYDKILTGNDLLVLSRKKLEFVSMPLNVAIPNRQYIEEIDKINSHRIPGFKSNVYNIRLLNSDIESEDLRNSIESTITATIKKITPVGSKLNKIVWE